MIVLVGFMGAGKSTVARLLAGRTGLPSIDTDESVEKRAGKPIAAIFDHEGEAAFRWAETQVVAEALEGPPAIVSVGGGAIEVPRTAELMSAATVVYLEVSLDEARRRIGGGTERPLMQREDIAQLHAARSTLYEAVADVRVQTDGISADEVADQILAQVELPSASHQIATVTVDLGPRSYDVAIGSGMLECAAQAIPEEASQAFVITHPELVAHALPLVAALKGRGLRARILTVPQGEASKSWEVAARLHADLAEAPAHRKDVVVAFGGGVVCDLAGFVASTYARGVRIVHVPTSLLAQVDAAIGGKTAIDLPQGKNLVGTFFQPSAVVCDVSLLATLPEAELRSGLAEVVKYGLIADPDLLDIVISRREEIFGRVEGVLFEIVRRSAAIKALVVSEDETEQGPRAWLNYGHTVGHAIERSHNFGGIRHGEAVALGMMAAAYLAEDLGRIDGEVVALHRRTLEAVGLPVRASLTVDGLEEAWTRDKKFDHGVRFVLLEGVGRPEAGITVGRDVIERALKRMA